MTMGSIWYCNGRVGGREGEVRGMRYSVLWGIRNTKFKLAWTDSEALLSGLTIILYHVCTTMLCSPYPPPPSLALLYPCLCVSHSSLPLLPSLSVSLSLPSLSVLSSFTFICMYMYVHTLFVVDTLYVYMVHTCWILLNKHSRIILHVLLYLWAWHIICALEIYPLVSHLMHRYVYVLCFCLPCVSCHANAWGQTE